MGRVLSKEGRRMNSARQTVRISVIIPTHNRRDYLLACLDSVAAQRRGADEVIVVDDGSTDGTAAAVAARPGVTLITQANAGPGAARNRGAAAATGDYLAFLDSDDLWFPWSLAVMAEVIAQHDSPAMIFARYVDFSGTLPTDAAERTPAAMTFPAYFDSAAHGFFAGAGMMVIARDAFHAVGGFAEDRLNAEDHDLAFRLGTAPGFAQITAPVIVAHRVHDGNAMGQTGSTLAGLTRMVANERAGRYPGGPARAGQRRSLILHHVRPAVVAAARTGAFRQAARLYLSTFLWNLRAGRGSYLAGVPALAVKARLKGIRA